MSDYTNHHDVAMRILVGRALAATGKGLPWSVDEDRDLILRERWLWSRLDTFDRERAQADLATLWGSRGAKRVVQAKPHWGPWAKDLGDVVIPDAAFGIPANDFRPSARGIGVLAQENPEFAGTLRWLWNRGFQPVDVFQAGNTIILAIPSHRVMQEADRLMAALAGDDVELVPLKNVWQPDSVKVLSQYDPASGSATISLQGAGKLSQLHDAELSSG